MKKLLLSLLLINLFSSCIQAEEYTEDDTYTIGLTYTSSPTYTLRFPRSFDISAETSTLVFSLKGDLYADQHLSVIFPQNVYIYNGQQSMPVTIRQDKSAWSCDELSDSFTDSGVILAHTPLSAGNWSGSLTITISLEGG